MPTISNVLWYYYLGMYNNGEHNPPHLSCTHIKDDNAVFNMEGELTDGDMPKKQMKLIAAWAELHKDELLANWELAISEQPLYKIAPLH